MKNRLFSLLKYLIGWPFSLLSLFFIIKIIFTQLHSITLSFHSIQITLLLAGIICFIIFYFFRGFIWYKIIKNFGSSLSFKEANYLWAISEMKRYVPGNIWALVGRTILFNEKGMTKKDIFQALLLEAEFFGIGCLFVSILTISFFAQQFGLHNTSLWRYLVFFILVVFTGIITFHKTITNFKLIRIFPWIKIFLPPFQPFETLYTIVLNIVSLLFFGLGYYLVITSFVFLHPQFILGLIGFFVLSFILGYLSVLTPAGFGVREGLLIVGLSKLMVQSIAAFAALFSRVVLIISEVLYIFLSYFWNNTKNVLLLKIEKWYSHNQQITSLFLLSVLYTIYFTTASFFRYDNFYTGRFDLGNMAQTVWNTYRGRFFILTNPNGTDPISRLAFHADFMLVLLAPFYAIWADPKMLLLIQVTILAVGSFFVYFIAKEMLKNNNLALTVAFAYLINPSLQRSNLYEFHAVTVATTLLLGMYFFYLKKKYLRFLLFAFLAAICKEQIWLIIALFGLLLFIHQKKRILGSAVFIFSVVTFYFLVWYAIPNTLGTQHFALTYYSEFGDSPTKIVKTILISPQKVLPIILKPDKLHYLTQLFSPLGYLSILSPFYLIFIIPDLLINLLSNNAQLHQIYYQYTATITPFIFISAIMSLNYLKKKLPKIPNYVFILFILYFSIRGAFLFGPLPGAKEPNIDMFSKQIQDKQFINSYLNHIPKRYSVAASNNVGSHLSQRQRIYTLPLGIDRADVIVFLLTDSEPEYSIKQLKQLVQKVKNDKRYHITVNQDKFIVFVKNR